MMSFSWWSCCCCWPCDLGADYADLVTLEFIMLSCCWAWDLRADHVILLLTMWSLRWECYPVTDLVTLKLNMLPWCWPIATLELTMLTSFDLVTLRLISESRYPVDENLWPGELPMLQCCKYCDPGADLLTFYSVADFMTLLLNLWPCCQHCDPRALHSTSVADLVTLEIITLPCYWPLAIPELTMLQFC